MERDPDRLENEVRRDRHERGLPREPARGDRARGVPREYMHGDHCSAKYGEGSCTCAVWDDDQEPLR